MPSTKPREILRRPDVSQRTGLGRSAIYAAVKEGRFPKPVKLDFAESGEAGRLYQRYARKTTTVPDQPLLYVPSSPSRDLAKDLESAGIPRSAPGGKIDFHACRVAYVSLVIESGATVKEAQELARHSVPDLTMNVYGRVQGDRLADRPSEWRTPSLGRKEYQRSTGRRWAPKRKTQPSITTAGCVRNRWWS